MTDPGAFPKPFDEPNSVFTTPRTLREIQMMRCSAAIRAKPGWYRKMTDPDIVDRWTREAVDQGMTPAQVRYVLAELAHYDRLRDTDTGIEVSAVDGVWQSDRLIDDTLRSRLAAAVRVLEDVDDTDKDWHPGSDNQVLDLVHPSLFCLVRGVSPAPESTWTTTMSTPLSRTEVSDKFQWLPTDATINHDGTVTFDSYINNVDPVAHHELAAVLPELCARMVPLWENVLTDLRRPRPRRIIANPYSWYDDEPDIDDDDETWENWYENRQPIIPDAPEFTAPHPIPDTDRVTLRGTRLQVIVKLANIHLTPDKPHYPGGSWHVEGMVNERIVSTAIYYWDSHNITDSRLGFRTAIDEPDYEQNDDNGVAAVYGLETDDALNQELGAADTPAGRCLGFPNILQHRVSPFALADPTRPGHRKVVVFFLVDPSQRITSSSDVPPQQPWADTTTMTLDQAKAFREELMAERKYVVDEHNEERYERPFSLCEH